MEARLYSNCHLDLEAPIHTEDNSSEHAPNNIVTKMGNLSIYWRDADHAIAVAERIKADALAIKGKRAASEKTAQGEKTEGTSQSEAPAIQGIVFPSGLRLSVSTCTNDDCVSRDDVRKTEYGPLCAPCREGMAKDHTPVEADAVGLGE